jgi:hypothetical protein
MKITIIYTPKAKEPQTLDKCTKLLFNYLETDKRFEKLIKAARVKLNIKNNKFLINKARQFYSLRSTSLVLNAKLDEIIGEYPTFQDWRYGLSKFICENKFIITNDNSAIRLKIKNSKYKMGMYEENNNEDGVKIVLSSQVSPTELFGWIKNNWYQIVYYIRLLPSFSRKRLRKSVFERDRLIAYLHTKWGKSWLEIAEDLRKIGVKVDNDKVVHDEYKQINDRFRNAFKDFPYK